MKTIINVFLISELFNELTGCQYYVPFSAFYNIQKRVRKWNVKFYFIHF